MLVCIGNNQLYACMLNDNPNSPNSASCWASNLVGDQVVGTCDASTAMLTKKIKLDGATVATIAPGFFQYYCCSPTHCSVTVPSASMCDDSTLWYCMTTGYYPSTTNASFSNASFSNVSFVCVIDSGNPFSMSDCVTSTLTFAIYLEPQCANITSPIFSSSTTQGSTTVTSSQIIISTVTTEGIMTSVDTTNLPTFTGTSGPGPSASALSSHSTPEWLTPLWTTILGSVAAAAIIWFFRRYISSRLPYC